MDGPHRSSGRAGHAPGTQLHARAAHLAPSRRDEYRRGPSNYASLVVITPSLVVIRPSVVVIRPSLVGSAVDLTTRARAQSALASSLVYRWFHLWFHRWFYISDGSAVCLPYARARAGG